MVRTFLSPPNWLGFGVADFVVLLASGLLLLLLALRKPSNRLRPSCFAWPKGPRTSMVILSASPVMLRLLLLNRHPVPVPSGADDFGYLLLADTLRHFRLANSAHAWPEFFEQIFVLQRPTYSSIYPLGQGLVLAAGWLVFRTPWAGVLVASGALSASTYWMLRGWVSEGWAKIGGLLAVAQFGPLCYWMNCYWGGYIPAIAGCLAFGAIPRLIRSGRQRDAILLGVGLAIHLLTRPFESILLACSVLPFVPGIAARAGSWTRLARLSLSSLAVLLPAAGLAALHNQQVTGSWHTLPYSRYRHDYGVPATFTFQSNPVPHRILNEEQELDYRAESIIHGNEPETPATYFSRLMFRLRFLRFFLLPPLYVALLFCFLSTGRNFWLPLTAILIFVAGSTFYPYFYPHYIAAISCLILLLAVTGLQKLAGRCPVCRVMAAGLTIFCFLPFLFWYGVHAFSARGLENRLAAYESWDYLNGVDPQGRATINQRLASLSGRQLVFVQYSPGHQFAEWVHNSADVDTSHTILVHDLGSSQNDLFRLHYPDRKAWLLQPDFQPPKLTPMLDSNRLFQDVP